MKYCDTRHLINKRKLETLYGLRRTISIHYNWIEKEINQRQENDYKARLVKYAS